MSEVLSAIDCGEPQAAERLLPLVYDELRRLAAQWIALERPGQTLQATGLVHEAYLRLIGKSTARGWENRAHFFAAAAEAMRRILVEQARKRKRHRHGGGMNRVDLLEEEVAAVSTDDEQILLLDKALDRLAATRPQAAELVKLRFFSGLTAEEAAPMLGLSPRTAGRVWAFARAWLRREMSRLGDGTC